LLTADLLITYHRVGDGVG